MDISPVGLNKRQTFILSVNFVISSTLGVKNANILHYNIYVSYRNNQGK